MVAEALKHIIKRISGLLDSEDCSDSSGGEVISPCAGADNSVAERMGTNRPSLDSLQQEFCRLIDIDIMQAKTYIESSVRTLEAVVGEWQVAAVSAGLMFTPEQLEDISSELPFDVPSNQILVDWLIKTKEREYSLEVREGLVRDYNV